MRVCWTCPDCNHARYSDATPCQDLYGSNATPEGGIFGRADGGYTSIEAQKAPGSLHGHSQLHMKCLHQHTLLSEVLMNLAKGKSHIVKDYLHYKQHVCRQVYADVAAWEARRASVEEAWP